MNASDIDLIHRPITVAEQLQLRRCAKQEDDACLEFLIDFVLSRMATPGVSRETLLQLPVTEFRALLTRIVAGPQAMPSFFAED